MDLGAYPDRDGHVIFDLFSRNARTARASKRTYFPSLMHGNRSVRGTTCDRVCSYTQLLLTLRIAATSSTVSSSCSSAASAFRLFESLRSMSSPASSECRLGIAIQPPIE